MRVVEPRSFQEPAVELIEWDYSSNCLTSEYMECDEDFVAYREPHRAAMPPRHCPHGFRGLREGGELWLAFQILRRVCTLFDRVVMALPSWKEMNLDRLLRVSVRDEVRR